MKSSCSFFLGTFGCMMGIILSLSLFSATAFGGPAKGGGTKPTGNTGGASVTTSESNPRSSGATEVCDGTGCYYKSTNPKGHVVAHDPSVKPSGVGPTHLSTTPANTSPAGNGHR
jgi:hypothetical protein